MQYTCKFCTNRDKDLKLCEWSQVKGSTFWNLFQGNHRKKGKNSRGWRNGVQLRFCTSASLIFLHLNPSKISILGETSCITKSRFVYIHLHGGKSVVRTFKNAKLSPLLMPNWQCHTNLFRTGTFCKSLGLEQRETQTGARGSDACRQNLLSVTYYAMRKIGGKRQLFRSHHGSANNTSAPHLGVH